MKALKRYPQIGIIIFILLLSLIAVPLQASAAGDDMLPEVREYLKAYYVDPVADDVLQAKTIKEMLDRLGDVNTEYFTKEEYEQFTDSLNRHYTGIGIELQMVAEGVLVTNVFKGYGADKAGIQVGDIIIAGGGDSFAGKSAEYCTSKLQGPAGSKVSVKVKREKQILNFTLERMEITLPTVESRLLEGHIGYILIYSFGEDTAREFGQTVKSLQDKGADCWIIDLRNNGGGYTQAALDLLGYFLNGKTALIAEDRNPPALTYRAAKQDFTVTGPVILLANRYTASSSEITAAALKDYEQAVIVGEKTYGSGLVKALIQLSNGDYLKLPIQRFYSPNKKPINKVGIEPDLELVEGDELQAAVLLLKNHNASAAQKAGGDKTGYLRLKAGPGTFALSLEDLRRPEYWQPGQKILDSAKVSTGLELGGTDGWQAVSKNYLQDRSKIYYPGYAEAGRLNNIPKDKIFTITFKREVAWESVSADSIELIDAVSGARVVCEFVFSDQHNMKVIPREQLKANSEYWLVVHPGIKDAAGQKFGGGIAVARTTAE